MWKSRELGGVEGRRLVGGVWGGGESEGVFGVGGGIDGGNGRVLVLVLIVG